MNNSLIDDPLLGTQLGNYRLDRVIGQGGMARVYYAWDVKLARAVAVKVIDARHRENEAYAKRFVREAQAISSWRHEHIVQVYYADDQDGLYFFAMEYIEGSDLQSVLQEFAAQGQKMPAAELIRVGTAVAEALDYAHQQGVIHRDVKPANIMLADDGRVVLTDFGLALDVDQGTMGEIFGSAHYIAPEQARHSADAVAQSDIYALGIVMYEALTGQVPFDDPSPTSVALQHITQHPPSPRSFNADLNVECENVLLHCLRKQPAERYDTAQEFMTALAATLTTSSENGAPLEALSTPTDPPMPEIGSMITIQIIGISLGLLLMLVVAVLVLRDQSIKNAPAPIAIPTITTVAPTVTIPAAIAAFTATSAPATEVGAAATPTSDVVTRMVATVSPAATIPAVAATPTSPVLQPTATTTTAATATILYPQGRLFQLFYNPNSFYVLNSSTQNSLIASLAFEQLGEGEQVLARFEGTSWAQFYDTIQSDFCVRAEIINQGPYLQPTNCSGRYNSLYTPAATDATIFWVERPGSTQFRVLWLGEEVGRCEIAAENCEIYVP